MKSKLISLDEAVDKVSSNSILALGGMTLYRRPFAFVKALIKNFQSYARPQNLTLLNLTASMESDLLLGAGLISTIRTCYFGLEIFGLAPMYTYLANRGQIEIIEETEQSIAMGLRAEMAGVGFMPSRAWIGTDLPKLRPDVKTVQDPYSGESLTAFPALKPDTAIIHALMADYEGNAVIGNNRAVDSELALTANQVIITTEEIVPNLEKVDLVSPLIDAIVHTPLGAQPSSCHPNYPLNGKVILDYVERVSDPFSFEKYLADWLNEQ